jgi:hypothetical protein
MTAVDEIRIKDSQQFLPGRDSQMSATFRSVAIAMLAVALVGLNRFAHADIIGPYVGDSDTLHLWHLDEADSTFTQASDAGTNSLPLLGKLQGATLSNTGASGTNSNLVPFNFGTALDTSANATSATPLHRPILLAASALSPNEPTATPNDNVSAQIAGASGSFTFEALIKFNSSFDPTSSTAFRPGTAMEIISGDSDGTGAGGSVTANRIFQFRVDQIGTSGSTVATGPRIEFANLNRVGANLPTAGGTNQSIFANIPTTGPNAVNNTDWFHVAVSYNGSEGAANNLSIYWTKVDPANTVANLIGQGTLNADLPSGTDFPFDLSLGDEARDTGSGAGEGESFVGQIDEVRISDIGRSSSQFIFSVPEPSSFILAGFGMIAFGGMLRRRKS